MVCGLIYMNAVNADFHVISQTEGTITATDFNISAQGKAESKGLKSSWTIAEGVPKVIVDSNLQNIWAFTTQGTLRVYCLRAGGRDQEVIDLVVPFPIPSKFYVRENGEGGSILCCIEINIAKLRDPTNIVITEIGFDSSGYLEPKEWTLSEMMAPVVVERFEDNEFYEWNWKLAGLDCRGQFPSRKAIPVFTVEKKKWVDNGTGLKGRAGLRLEEDSATIVWNFENGFEVMEAQEEELDPIEIPGNNRITGKSVNFRTLFSFPSKASEFGNVERIIGIRPDGDNLPEPRFPLPMQEKKFREDTKTKISNLESEIEDLKGMFRDHVRSHD